MQLIILGLGAIAVGLIGISLIQKNTAKTPAATPTATPAATPTATPAATPTATPAVTPTISPKPTATPPASPVPSEPTTRFGVPVSIQEAFDLVYEETRAKIPPTSPQNAITLIREGQQVMKALNDAGYEVKTIIPYSRPQLVKKAGTVYAD